MAFIGRLISLRLPGGRESSRLMSNTTASETRLHPSSEEKMGKVIAFSFAAFIFIIPVAPHFHAQKKETRSAAGSVNKKSGIDAGRIIRLQSRMQSFVNQGRTAGMVTLVAH